ncbi:MAG: PilZ domain-containing protein [Desulfovibrionaceae bacterium]|nr:PilZ domain-containing protein [Desulfovibrionaceae bacterium]
MPKTVTICFDATDSTREALEHEAEARDVKVDEIINRAIEQFLTGHQLVNRRLHGRVDVDMSAVARPIDGEIGTAILPGRILDISEGGLKLQCHSEFDDIEEVVKVGGQVEIIFTVPDKEYPVCFTCEVRHIYRKASSELGCEFVDASNENFDSLKAILSANAN